jgi:hypothetical protein
MLILSSCLSKSQSAKEEEKKAKPHVAFIGSNTLQPIAIIDSIAISRAMELSPEDAINLYGKTISGYLGKDEEFVLDRGLTEFRIELFNYYTEEQIDSKSIIIKELTWAIDSINNLTIWYEKIDSMYYPKDFYIWDKNLEF